MPLQDPNVAISSPGTMPRRVLPAVILAGVGLCIYLLAYDHLQLSHRLNQAKDIALVSGFYAKDHGGRMPSSFDQLSPWTGPNYGGAVDAVARQDHGTFEFVGATGASNPDSVLVRERTPDSHGRRVVGYANGSASVSQERH